MSTTLDPCLRPIAQGRSTRSRSRQDPQPRPSSSSSSSSSPADSDEDLEYYRFKRQKTENVCPFSDPSRPNPCVDHAAPRSRKDSIMKHLNKVKQDPDPQHPKNDPIWASRLVRYFLTPRPKKYDNQKRKRGNQVSQHEYYVKRTKIQSEKGPEMKAKYLAGEIAKEEYAKVLIGNARREFLAEERVKDRLQLQFAADNDRAVQEKLEEKLRELRQTNVTGDDDEIRDLEAIRDKLTACESMLGNHRQEISLQSAKVVQFFSFPGFLQSEEQYLSFHSMHFPTKPSVKAYFEFAVLLLPPCDWDGQVRSQSTMRALKRTLHMYLEGEKDGLDPEEMEPLTSVMAIFNSSCDLLKEEDRRVDNLSLNQRQKWMDEQDDLWRTERAKFQKKSRFYARPAIEQYKLIDEFADMYREMKRAEIDTEVARQHAQQATSG